MSASYHYIYSKLSKHIIFMILDDYPEKEKLFCFMFFFDMQCPLLFS